MQLMTTTHQAPVPIQGWRTWSPGGPSGLGGGGRRHHAICDDEVGTNNVHRLKNSPLLFFPFAFLLLLGREGGYTNGSFGCTAG